jgi:hypothetical protein
LSSDHLPAFAQHRVLFGSKFEETNAEILQCPAFCTAVALC